MRYQAKHREPGASQVQAWYVLVDAVRSSSPEQQQNKTETTTNRQNRTDTNQQTDGQRNQRPTPGTEQNQTTDNRTNGRSEETSKNMQRNQKREVVGRRSANAASKRQRNHAPAGTPVSYPMFAGYAVGSLLKDINPDANMHACAVEGATPTSVRSLGQRKDQLRSHMQNECFIKTALKTHADNNCMPKAKLCYHPPTLQKTRDWAHTIVHSPGHENTSLPANRIRPSRPVPVASQPAYVTLSSR